MTCPASILCVVAFAEAHAASDAVVPAAWSRPVSSRADSKLAPCMARPNLFSGD